MPFTETAILVLVICVAVGVVSIGTFVYCFRRSQLAQQSIHWPTTRGKVVASLVDNDEDDRPTTRAVLAYEFEVDGVRYQSTDVYPRWDPFSATAPLVKAFPLESAVKVYYLTGNPSVSCLYPGRPGGPRSGMLISIGVLVLALAFAYATRP